jgi:hypothetical protein
MSARAPEVEPAAPTLAKAATVRLTLRFVRHVPSLLRNPTSAGQARDLVTSGLADRQPAFLDRALRAVYRQPGSPYARLLEHAGCEHGDLTRLVSEHGLEGALAELAASGVYLTVDEFKGRRPVRRGSTTFECGPAAVRNPLSAFHLAVRSGGTRSPGTPVLMDLRFVRGCGATTCMFLRAWGDDGWRKALWETPGAGARFRLLEYASFGAVPERWFSQVDVSSARLDPVFRWSERATRFAARLAGAAVPRPEHVSLEDPLPIARWMAEVISGGGHPFLFTFPSSAVRLCRAAADAGLDLTGARISLTGEPITSARLATVRASGAAALPRYGSMETGPIALGCLAPESPDDMHVLADLQALIQAPEAVRAAEGLPAGALLITALHTQSPFLLLNASMGDEGQIAPRSCGCPVQQLGYSVHLSSVRSFEKLTSEGMTFMDTDVIRVLENVLPAEFGGSPTDYQLVEREDDLGRARLRLLVHPRLGELDEERVKETFLRGLEAGGAAATLMGLLWRDAELVSVARTAPRVTGAGKIQHLHREPASGTEADGTSPAPTSNRT